MLLRAWCSSLQNVGDLEYRDKRERKALELRAGVLRERWCCSRDEKGDAGETDKQKEFILFCYDNKYNSSFFPFHGISVKKKKVNLFYSSWHVRLILPLNAAWCSDWPLGSPASLEVHRHPPWSHLLRLQVKFFDFAELSNPFSLFLWSLNSSPFLL